MIAKNPFDCRKAFLVVTGASRGIGRTIVVEFSRRLPSHSVCLLLARSEPGLKDTKIEAEYANPNIIYHYKSLDLAKPEGEELTTLFTDCLNGRAATDFDQAIIIHNVGSLGDVSEPASNMGDQSKWQEYFSLNFFSVTLLNKEFMKMFRTTEVKNRLIINITSLCSLQPMKSMGYYCCGKAAREMYFKVLAEEEEGKLTVLNYSPGPVATDMFNEILNHTCDKDIKKTFSDMQDRKTVLTCHQTIMKLIEVVKNGTYKSGDHVDYFD